MDLLRRRWKSLLLLAALVAAVVGGYVYWTFFRVDPEFAAKQAAQKEKMEQLDRALGVEGGDDDFDHLDQVLEGDAE